MSRLIQIFVSQAQGLAVPEQQAELEAQRLELELDQLEDRVRRLLDPGHAEFDCDLPMARCSQSPIRPAAKASPPISIRILSKC